MSNEYQLICTSSRSVTLEWLEILLIVHTTLFSQRVARFLWSGLHQRCNKNNNCYMVEFSLTSNRFHCTIMILYYYRPSSIKSIPLIVMYGAMVWCYLRSGQLERSRSQRYPTVKLWGRWIQVTVSLHLLGLPDPSTNSWLTAGEWIM